LPIARASGASIGNLAAGRASRLARIEKAVSDRGSGKLPMARPAAPRRTVADDKEQDMSNTPHTLGEEFPGQMDRVHALKVSDPRFARLLADYDAVNDEIHRSETGIAPTSDEHETEARKRRLAIKDRIAEALAQPA
jgi:uncharacterized protein YdcH (DUF465 family)